MKSYKILEFGSAQQDTMVYTLNETSGNYTFVAGATPRGELDLLYDRFVIILKVQDTTRTSKIFKIGDVLEGGQVITSFKFVNNKLCLVINTNFVHSLSSANLRAEPVAVPKNLKNVLKSIENRILRERPLQLGNNSSHVFINPNQPLVEFMYRFFGDYNQAYNTCYSHGERASEQTPVGKRRSLTDIFLICRKYYPACTLKEVVQFLYVDIYARIPHLRTLKCSSIHKRVWWLSGEHFPQDKIKHRSTPDEFDYTFDEYIAMLSLEPAAAEPVKSVSKLEEAKTKYTVGKRVASQMGGIAFIIDSKVFDETTNYIVNISKAGTRRVLYNKNTETWSRITS